MDKRCEHEPNNYIFTFYLLQATWFVCLNERTHVNTTAGVVIREVSRIGEYLFINKLAPHGFSPTEHILVYPESTELTAKLQSHIDEYKENCGKYSMQVPFPVPIGLDQIK